MSVGYFTTRRGTGPKLSLEACPLGAPDLHVASNMLPTATLLQHFLESQAAERVSSTVVNQKGSGII